MVIYEVKNNLNGEVSYENEAAWLILRSIRMTDQELYLYNQTTKLIVKHSPIVEKQKKKGRK
jgi:hypothetical protein